MHQLMRELFPICRSITGNGVRETLNIIRRHVPVAVHEVPTGTKVFDWTIPQEWNISDAYVLDGAGAKVIDFKKNNLHVVGYSVPIDTVVSLAELQDHLFSLDDKPDAIPYVTSYYQPFWGFCLSDNDRKKLTVDTYRVVIDSELTDGFLTYGDLVIPGESPEEVFLSTYVCHPSMANNELSGPVVTTWLAKWIAEQPRHYTYRIAFVPETIGSLTYLARHLEHLRKRVIAGFNVTCIGDEGRFSFVPSRNGLTLADRVALKVLRDERPDFVRYSYLDRGSDERQYCSPGADLPVASVMRSKYREYPEYHTSLDDLSFVTPVGLQGSFEVSRACLELLERNGVYQAAYVGEPQLGRRGLYPTLSTGASPREASTMLDLLAYADGTNDLLSISETICVPVRELYPVVDTLLSAGLLIELDGTSPK